jgi:hypothetical protein
MGFRRVPAEPSRSGSALGGSLRGSPEAEATVEVGPKPLLEAGTGQRRKTKGRLNLAGGLPLSRLFRSSSVDLLDDLRMQVGDVMVHGADGEENGQQANGVHEKDRAKEYAKGTKGSWLPFTKPKPKRHSPYPERPVGPTRTRTPERDPKARLDRSDWEWDRGEDLGRRAGLKARGA